MIVKWIPNCLKYIQADDSTNVTLIPGNNEVLTAVWTKCREHVLDLIKSVDIVEVKTSIKEGTLTATEFSKLEAKDAEAIAKETFSVASLQGWLESEGRNSVRGVLQNRLDEVLKYGTK